MFTFSSVMVFQHTFRLQSNQSDQFNYKAIHNLRAC